MLGIYRQQRSEKSKILGADSEKDWTICFLSTAHHADCQTPRVFLLHLNWNQNSFTSHRLNSVRAEANSEKDSLHSWGTSGLASTASTPVFLGEVPQCWLKERGTPSQTPREWGSSDVPEGTGTRGPPACPAQVPCAPEPQGWISVTTTLPDPAVGNLRTESFNSV